MVPCEIECKGCGVQLEVTSWKKFIRCPFCETKNDFPGFDYKILNRNESMYASMKYEQDCPSCRSPHMLASSRIGNWKCVDCGYMLSGLRKINSIFWFCDNCETYLNIQNGFTTKNKIWKCAECGYTNNVTRKNLL